jgi:hypothetical protein
MTSPYRKPLLPEPGIWMKTGEPCRSGDPAAAVPAGGVEGELRRGSLSTARYALKKPGVRGTYEAFVETAGALSGSDALYEMVRRPDLGARPPPSHAPAEAMELRPFAVATVTEAGIQQGCRTVVLAGKDVIEFLPGLCCVGARVLDTTSVAMDIGSFRTVEEAPPPDADTDGMAGPQSITLYARIEITGEAVETSIAVSSMDRAADFVAAYREYVETLAGRPYQEIHPQRAPGASVAPRPALAEGQGTRPARATSQAGVLGGDWSRLTWPGGMRSRAARAWNELLERTRSSKTFPRSVKASDSGVQPAGIGKAIYRLTRSARAWLQGISFGSDPKRALILLAPCAVILALGLYWLGAFSESSPPQTAPAAVASTQPAPPPVGPSVARPPRPQAVQGPALREGRTTANARLRAAPSTGAATLRILPMQTELRILEVTADWMRVSTDEGAAQGWIHRSLIE